MMRFTASWLYVFQEQHTDPIGGKAFFHKMFTATYAVLQQIHAGCPLVAESYDSDQYFAGQRQLDSPFLQMKLRSIQQSTRWRRRKLMGAPKQRHDFRLLVRDAVDEHRVGYKFEKIIYKFYSESTQRH